MDASICAGLEKPPVREVCRRADCPEWEIGPHDPCPVSCGSGRAFRRVDCVVPGVGATVEADCDAASRPSNYKVCSSEPCPPPLPAASALFLRAIVSTAEPPSLEEEEEVPPPPSLQLLADDAEDEEEDREGEDVSMGPVRWVKGPWGDCSGDCGGPGSLGWKFRQVVCRDLYSRHLADKYCSHARKPRNKAPCSPCPSADWSFGPWSEV